jgi:hypothetical protein
MCEWTRERSLMSAKTPIIGGYVRRAKGHLSKRCQPLHIRVGVGTILPIDKPMDICVPVCANEMPVRPSAVESCVCSLAQKCVASGRKCGGLCGRRRMQVYSICHPSFPLALLDAKMPPTKLAFVTRTDDGCEALLLVTIRAQVIVPRFCRLRTVFWLGA